jgi:hypothetical protein
MVSACRQKISSTRCAPRSPASFTSMPWWPAPKRPAAAQTARATGGGGRSSHPSLPDLAQRRDCASAPKAPYARRYGSAITQFALLSDAANLRWWAGCSGCFAGVAGVMERRRKARDVARLEQVGWVPWMALFMLAAIIGGGLLAMSLPAVIGSCSAGTLRHCCVVSPPALRRKGRLAASGIVRELKAGPQAGRKADRPPAG